MRILITGGRSWSDQETIREALLVATLGIRWTNVTFIHGNARGADLIGAQLAAAYGMNVEVYPARWDLYGRAAGPIRNQEMVDTGANVCLAFLMPGSVGTADCVRRAEKAGIEVRKYHA